MCIEKNYYRTILLNGGGAYEEGIRNLREVLVSGVFMVFRVYVIVIEDY